MSRNAGGTYTLPAGNPVVTATVISSVWANTTLSDIATEMTDSLDRSGKGGMLAPLQLTDGVVGAPALTFTTEPTSGVYRVSAGVFGLSIGATQKFQFSGAVDSTNLLITAAGGRIVLSRSSDGSPQFVLGSDTVGGSSFSVKNTGGTGSEFLVGAGSFQMLTGASVQRFVMSGTLTVATTLYEGVVNVGAAGLYAIATQELGSFTATITGCTTAPTALWVYTRVGNCVTLTMPGLTATSNSTSLTFTGLPANLQPVRAGRCFAAWVDNGVAQIGMVGVAAGSGTITAFLGTGLLAAGFTAAGTKGASVFSFTYSLV